MLSAPPGTHLHITRASFQCRDVIPVLRRLAAGSAALVLPADFTRAFELAPPSTAATHAPPPPPQILAVTYRFLPTKAAGAGAAERAPPRGLGEPALADPEGLLAALPADPGSGGDGGGSSGLCGLDGRYESQVRRACASARTLAQAHTRWRARVRTPRCRRRQFYFI
jgi:hypothetical protein